ncbi:MAG: histidinol dehydrogenase [Actinobacteria bacterium]|nr:histidinol dehydrogenase [Actinomycetota bacterium]
MGKNFLKIRELAKIEEPGALTGKSAALRDIKKKSFEIEKTVSKILKDIRRNGEPAVLDYIRKFDGYEPGSIRDVSVSGIQVEEATLKAREKYPRLVRSLKKAYHNISEYHRHQLISLEKSWSVKSGDGKETGQLIRPLERVGLYIPGGRYLYPSSILMAAVPALIAGVKEIVLCSPPGTGGNLDDILLYMCRWLGINEVYKIGGAQAIGLMAYGCTGFSKVDKIAGPGNAYVTEAKKQVFGTVGIDSLAGPSDITVLSDGSGNPSFVAHDMLAQSEHDPESRSILLTTSRDFAEQVAEEIYRGLRDATSGKKADGRDSPAGEVISSSLKNNCRIIHGQKMDDLIDLCNMIAPEHLEIITGENKKILKKVRNAGAIFLGEYSPVALGDYMGGTNHIIPTGGNARFSSPLGVYDFIKRSSYISYSRGALEREKEYIEEIACFEGLKLHADSVKVRFEVKNGPSQGQ